MIRMKFNDLQILGSSEEEFSSDGGQNGDIERVSSMKKNLF